MGVFEDVLAFVAAHYAVLIASTVPAHLLYNRFRRHLRSIPGPPLAGFSDLWRFLDALIAKPHKTHIDLHRKYASTVVRVGPNVVSVSNPAFIPTIYGLNSGYNKTPFYNMFVLPANRQFTRSLFTTRDEKYHQKYKRPIASAYSMSTLVEFEPFVDSTTKFFMSRLDEFVESGAAFNIGMWLQMYAFDVV